MVILLELQELLIMSQGTSSSFPIIIINNMPIHYSSHLRDCYFCASSAMKKTEFIQAINTGFNSGGMFCTLSDSELGHYLLGKVMDFMKEPDKRILRAVSNIGQQDTNPPVFVLSPEVGQRNHLQSMYVNFFCYFLNQLHLNEEGLQIYNRPILTVNILNLD